MFDRQRRKSSVDDGVDMDGLQAGLEKLAMKPKVGWCVVHIARLSWLFLDLFSFYNSFAMSRTVYLV